MTSARTLIRTGILMLLAGVAMHSTALTLGAMKGAATVGQPLDLASGIRLGNEPEPCITAEVMYGDVALHASQLRVSLQAGPDGATMVRVRSSVPVNEPVVTVTVTAGCGQQSMRRYVVLADPPAAASARPTADAAGRQEAPAPTAATPRNLATRAPTVTPPPAALRTAGADKAQPRASRATPVQAAPRLALSAVSTGAERPAVLRASAEMVSVPTNDPAERATAAAMWRALSVDPQALIETAERLQQLEAGMVQALEAAEGAATPVLFDLPQPRQTTLAPQIPLAPPIPQGMQERPSSSSASFSPSPAQAGLAAALLLMLGGLAVRVCRRRSVRTHWSASEIASENGYDSRSHADAARLATAPPMTPARTAREVMPLPPLAPAGSAPYKPLFSSSQWELEIPVRMEARPLAPHPLPPAERVQVLEHALQESAFFGSLGQHAAAAGPLIAYIDADTQAAPLAYLELLQIYKLVDSQEDHELWSDAFFCSFAVDVPAFDDLDTPGQPAPSAAALESHPATLALVTTAWAAQHACEVIEELLLGPPHGSDLMTVHAYRELLWLHAVYRELNTEPGAWRVHTRTATGDDNLIDFRLD